MEAAFGDPRHGRVDRELVAAGVDADFVRAVVLCDLGVILQRGLERLQIAFVVDAFLELTDEAWGQAHHVRHLAPLQFEPDEEVIERTRD